MNPFFLEELYERMGRPRWFWPLVLIVIFLLFVLGSTLGSDIDR